MKHKHKGDRDKWTIIIVLFIVMYLLPSTSLAFDGTAPQVTRLDAKTFVIAKEWASEIRVFLLKVEDNNKMVLIDSCSIDYMTLKPRHAASTLSPKKDGSLETTPIIKKIK
ncbi:MAG: hypothetical protein DRG37_02665 [Deltaproteobacteria bacterium]|nr:MAG: hypothetical protein DRG37_02665 [Deltaproteobacteria bacterium]